MDEFLRNYIVDSHYDTQRTSRGAVLECVHQVASKPEDFISIAEDETAHFRWNKCAAGFREQLLSESCFEGAQLCTDRGRRQCQFFASLGQASRSDHRPEVE